MSEMPSSIQVGPFAFRVRCDQAAMDRERVANDATNRSGQLDRWNQQILIAPEVARDVARVTLLHEVLHGCYMVAGQSDATLSEEGVVCFLGPVLLDILRRNPALVAYLLEKEMVTA